MTLDNDMALTVDWWYRSTPKNWYAGKQVYVFYDLKYQQLKIEDPITQDVAWSRLKSKPAACNKIKSISNGVNSQGDCSKVVLDNGWCFESVQDLVLSQWEVKSPIAILANPDGCYQLWNLKLNQLAQCNIIDKKNRMNRDALGISIPIDLEDRLNGKVLQQSQAAEALTNSLLIYQAGLKDKNKPIGVFLFLGPTGVGKTELAKALSLEIYKDPLAMIRFDMSHFSEPHYIARLIGSPPGYLNHEEGGQLTNPLMDNPFRVVLLDELEKCHPIIIKTFLPVFDEGFILDVKNNHISCSDTIFIMTSNLCGQEIARMYNEGLTSEAILERIEPKLMEVLSPEIYNRVQPILFQPLAKETMGSLVELMLSTIIQKLETENDIRLHIDDSLKRFLAIHGYHPLLGARPLKKLIEQEIIVFLAKRLVNQTIKKGESVSLSYDGNSVIILP